MQFINSPNYTPGRTSKVDRVVIHWMVGTLASTDTQFKNPASKVSAHYGIENQVIHQYVEEKDTAWHAGVGSMNARSIGIEHSADPNRPASQETYETSAQLIYEICERYDIPIDRKYIIKHSEVPYATQCCGTIDIDYLVKRAKEIKEANMFPYPQPSDLDYIYKTTNYLGHAPNANDIAYWCSGTGNNAWPAGSAAVWKDLLYDVSKWVSEHPNGKFKLVTDKLYEEVK